VIFLCWWRPWLRDSLAAAQIRRQRGADSLCPDGWSGEISGSRRALAEIWWGRLHLPGALPHAWLVGCPGGFRGIGGKREAQACGHLACWRDGLSLFNRRNRPFCARPHEFDANLRALLVVAPDAQFGGGRLLPGCVRSPGWAARIACTGGGAGSWHGFAATCAVLVAADFGVAWCTAALTYLAPGSRSDSR